MEIAVILVNWNQPEVTIRCVESLLENTRADPSFNYHIIIVDNASTRQSVQLLEKYLSENSFSKTVKLLKNDVNAGFAGGNNLGIRYAQQQYAPDYIWLLNNDIIVQENALNHLVAASRKFPDIKIWGSTIYEIHPQLHFHCAGGFRYNAFLSIPTPVQFPPEEQLSEELYYPLPQLDYPAGASMFIKADTFEKHGLLNETYFLYYEELDFVHQIGGRTHIAWCPASRLYHQAGKSTGSRNPNKGEGSRIAHYYGNLSALKYTWSYHTAYFPVVFLFRLISKSILFLKHRDFKGFHPLLRAYLDFFKWVRDPRGSNNLSDSHHG